MRSIKVIAAAFVVSALSTVVGCAVPATDDAERFRTALPLQEDVALHVPGAASATHTEGLHIATGPGLGTSSSNARYYQFTRDMTSIVDTGTGAILGVIWAIVNTPPTTLEPKKAVWGPGSDSALEPAVWRFTVNEVGTDEYDYELEGQLKSGGSWTSVMKGHGYGKTRPEHKQGWFQWDNDAQRSLDPSRTKDEGTTKITYDLTKAPATIAVEVRPHPADLSLGWSDVKVIHDQGGAGSVEISSLGDVDASKDTKLEDVHLLSRWTTDGSGRADIDMKNGDLPFTVDATECWSSAFTRVYYQDTVNYEPKTGDASACAFKQ